MQLKLLPFSTTWDISKGVVAIASDANLVGFIGIGPSWACTTASSIVSNTVGKVLVGLSTMAALSDKAIYRNFVRASYTQGDAYEASVDMWLAVGFKALAMTCEKNEYFTLSCMETRIFANLAARIVLPHYHRRTPVAVHYFLKL